MSEKAASAKVTSPLGEQRFSGKLSDDYPLWRLARPFLDEVHEVLASELGRFIQDRSPPLRALDLGTGDGAIARLLLAEPKLAVTGVDNEPKMLDQAREALSASLAGGRLNLVLDNALHFLSGQPAGSFDVVASGYVLHNLTAAYRSRLYPEIWRVLIPTGMFINADKYAQSGEAHRDALRWQLGLFFEVLGARGQYDLLREWVLHYAEDETADRVMPETGAIADLQNCGFTSVGVTYRKHMDAVLIARKDG